MSFLPADAADRLELHGEAHARPAARIRLPALISVVAVLNEGVAREQELAHLRARNEDIEQLDAFIDGSAGRADQNFVRLRSGDHVLRWERHGEYTRYVLIRSLPDEVADGRAPIDSADLLAPAQWWSSIPGCTIAAVNIAMSARVHADTRDELEFARAWLGAGALVASQLGGGGRAIAYTDLALHEDGFVRMLVRSDADITETRAGRIAQRLMEIEIYRLMALRGLPVAKKMARELGEAERMLSMVTADLVDTKERDADLLDRLTRVAARIERETAQHLYRFSATQAYDGVMRQRIAELREQQVPGAETIGEFMQRRQAPAIATVVATAQRLSSLSERTARASALLRTRVDIATEAQNQVLLSKLTRGQELQLRLQSMVEGLSIAAISYYVISLVLYAGKALKDLGAPLKPELLAGLSIPVVLLLVWKATQRIHERLHRDD